MKKIVLAIVSVALITSCKKDVFTPPEPFPTKAETIDTSGFIDIDISNVINNNAIVLSTGTYTNANNDTYSIDLLKYYISNVSLVTTNSVVCTIPDSYFLVNQSIPNSTHLKLKKVDYANYSGIEFTIGVDAARNTAGAQTGALDPINDMFWTWNSGYIMAKIEGHSPQSPNANNSITYHIGGFQGTYTGVRKVNLQFPTTANVYKNHTPTVNINADINKWFTGAINIDLGTVNLVTMPSKNGNDIANNYKNMFNVVSVIN